jgi:hypothetical protein
MSKNNSQLISETEVNHWMAKPMITSSPALSENVSRFSHKRSLNRRSFLSGVGASAAATVAIGVAGLPQLEGTAEADDIGPVTGEERRALARQIRHDMAQLAFDRPLPEHPDNGEETDYPFVAN